MTQEDTLRTLLQNHEAAIRRIAGVYGGGEGEEEDLYQEILMQLWSSLPNFRGDSAAGTWLYRVALNTALTWRRRVKRHAVGLAPIGPGADGVTPTTHGSPRSQAAILSDFLSTLGGPDRAVLLLYVEGLSYREIADVTGLSVNAVGIRLHRMKQAFTERFVER